MYVSRFGSCNIIINHKIIIIIHTISAASRLSPSPFMNMSFFFLLEELLFFGILNIAFNYTNSNSNSNDWLWYKRVFFEKVNRMLLFDDWYKKKLSIFFSLPFECVGENNIFIFTIEPLHSNRSHCCAFLATALYDRAVQSTKKAQSTTAKTNKQQRRRTTDDHHRLFLLSLFLLAFLFLFPHHR